MPMCNRKTPTVPLGTALAVALCVALAGCGRAEPDLPVRSDARHPGRFLHEFEALGTDATLMVAARDAAAARDLFRPAVAAVRRVEARMSTYRPESEISTLNRLGAREDVSLSEDTLQVLREAVRFSRLTDGAFDVTYAPLRTLWRKAEREGRLPAEEEIAGALHAVGSDKLILGEHAARFTADGMEVDLGGIAKGYAIELAAQAMKRAGARSALVDVGGDMRVVGRREDGARWQVEVRDPRPGARAPMVLELEDAGVATSGDYARFFRVGEKTFSHIVDPRTGRAVRDVPSATVVAPDATTADALATAASVLGAQKALELVNGLDGVECMIMARSGDSEAAEFTLYYSDGFRALMEEK